MPQVVENPQGTHLTWNINNSFPPDSSIVWTIFLETSSDEFDCGEFPIDFELKEVTEVVCIDGGICAVENNIFNFTESIAVELGNLSLANLIFETENAGNDSVWVNYSVDIENTGVAISGIINLAFFETNTSTALYQDSLNTDLNTNEIIEITGQFIAHESDICPIELVIDGCTCDLTPPISAFPTFTDSSEVILCAGETFDFNGTTLSEAGIFCQEFNNTNDCDSIICVEILLSDTFNIVEPMTICAGETIDFNGEMLFENGLFCQNFQTFNGCDSTHCIELTVLDTFYIAEMATICDGESINFNGQILTETNLYCQTFTAANNCDSTFCLNLTVLNNVTKESAVSACANTPYIWNGETLPSSGSYTQNFVSNNGCDSTHILTLTIVEEVLTSEFIEFCEEDQPTWNGESLTDIGDYFFETIVQLPNGCDSIHTTEITVYPSPEITIAPTPSPLWIGESITLETTGNAVWAYLWSPSESLNCDDCPSPTATPNENTEYTLIVTDENGCEANDAIHLAVQNCLDTPTKVPNMITPNDDGVNDEFWIYEQGGLDNLEFMRIWDRWGNLVFQTNNLGEKWDAHYQGKKVSSGVFAYHIKGICVGGEEVEMKGNVTVVR